MRARVDCAYARTPSGAVHYAQTGDGPPLLLLHATPGSYRAYLNMLPLLAPHFRAIAVDTPGFGNSDPPPGKTTIDGLAECLVRLLDALGIERAHVFGLHTGNKIAAALGAVWPTRIDRIVLAGQTHSLIVDHVGRGDAIRALVDHYFPAYGDSIDGTHYLRRWVAAHADVEKLWWPPRLLTGATVTAKDVEWAEAQVIDYLLGWRAIMPTYEAIFAFDLAAAMRRIDAPTLVLELLTSHESHFGEQAPAICRIMKRAQSAALADADGAVLHTRPDEVVRAILPFLTSN